MLIFGSHCKQDKALMISIQQVFGINKATALTLCAMLGLNPLVKLNNLKPSVLELLKSYCRIHLEPNLQRYHKQHVKQLIELKHYKGVRHMFGLPVRGQRTRTNATTAKTKALIKPKKSLRLTVCQKQ